MRTASKWIPRPTLVSFILVTTSFQVYAPLADLTDQSDAELTERLLKAPLATEVVALVMSTPPMELRAHFSVGTHGGGQNRGNARKMTRAQAKCRH